MKQFILGLLTETLNKSDEELTDLLYQASDEGEETLKEGSLDVVKKLFEEKFQKIKVDSETKLKTAQDDFHKKGKKEAMEKLESEIREKYELESETEGIELVDAVIEKYKQVDTKLTPDKVKLHETYREAEKQWKKTLKDELAAKEKEINELKTGHEKEKTWSQVSRDIRGILMNQKPVLPKNNRAAENLVNIFLESFREYEWQLGDNGEHLAIKDGKRVEDNLANIVEFKALVEKRIPEYFDLAVQDGKGSAGNESGQGGSGSSNGVPDKFESNEAYLKWIDAHPGEENIDNRIKAMENWKKQEAAS